MRAGMEERSGNGPGGISSLACPRHSKKGPPGGSGAKRGRGQDDEGGASDGGGGTEWGRGGGLPRRLLLPRPGCAVAALRVSFSAAGGCEERRVPTPFLLSGREQGAGSREPPSRGSPSGLGRSRPGPKRPSRESSRGLPSRCFYTRVAWITLTRLWRSQGMSTASRGPARW